jgi:peptide/nickel transport system substrate-binding protein
MKKTRYLALASACAAISMVLAGCGTSSSKKANTTPQGAGYGAGATTVVNPSSHTGGTLILNNPSDWDSTDPGNTYYGFSWDFLRLYARTLVAYAPAPGTAGEKLVPDLATSLGQVGNNGLTWTYHLKAGIKFEDGETVTSQDVKYAIERTGSYFPKAKGQAVLNGGPVYWGQVLTDPAYPGAFYDNSPGKMGLTAIDTPDPNTIVFHLQKPFAEFDFLAALSQTAPVPPAKDTGINYLKHPLSTGPYMFQGDYVPGKGFTLVRNPNWSASTDSIRKQLVDKVVVTVSVPPAQLDNRLLSGQTDLDVHGLGIAPSDQVRVLTNPTYKANADDVLNGFYNYVAIVPKVAPFSNVHCRLAVLLAADHAEVQTAYGGQYGGDIATQSIPPVDQGYIAGYDPYGFASHPHGDIAGAKAQLAQCGKPNGFSVTMAIRTDETKEPQVAQALQASLAKVGIKVDLFNTTVRAATSTEGTPAFVHSHNIGLIITGWGADWPSGWGYYQDIANGAVIAPAGNYNYSELNDPVVNHALDTVIQNTAVDARVTIYQQINRQIMQDAVWLPLVNQKALLYRNPRLTNVYYSGGLLMYDYSQIGIK